MGYRRGELARVHLKDIELKPIGRSNKKVSLGDLWGNRFKIVIRNIGLSLDETSERVRSITSELEKGGPISSGCKGSGRTGQ